MFVGFTPIGFSTNAEAIVIYKESTLKFAKPSILQTNIREWAFFDNSFLVFCQGRYFQL